MFYDNNDCGIAKCADDNTPYCSSFILDKAINKLEASTNNLFEWFHENHMKANAGKCHQLVTTKSAVSTNIGEFVINNCNKEKLSVIKIDCKLYRPQQTKNANENFCYISVQLLCFDLNV